MATHTEGDNTVRSISTPQLLLSPLTTDDVDRLIVLDSDPRVTRYLTGGRPSAHREVAELVRSSGGHMWTAWDREPRRFVGWFSLRPSRDHEFELGYRLAVDAWGRGLATEGSRALIDHGFGQLDATRVWAQTMSVNRKSKRVMERCGLRFVRVFHLHWEDPIPGSEAGEVEYSLTREEWVQHREASMFGSGDDLTLDEPDE